MSRPYDRDLPEGRHRLLKEFVMTEIDKPKRRLLRPIVLAPALGLAAAAAVAIPLLLGGTPAYAIADNPDGTVNIQINEVKDADKLQSDLRAKGINVVVNYIPRGKKCSPQPRAAHFLPKEVGLVVWPPPEGANFTIDPSVIKEGQTGVLEFSVGGVQGSVVAGIWARVAEGPVADCTLVDTTDAPLSH
ncbi:hypothetical protein [Nonomuraea guangzhouensis]|uniref:Uncharacterized protein n=1 Tax=Nonomuraea guangzhouensis TaxID=1291555 RepID=A0ABW4G2H7_9ACTN|nr:hypothetical protein [Nonomuraea guangzhouensis]